MYINLKKYLSLKKKAGLYTLIPLMAVSLLGTLPLFEPKIQEVEADFEILGDRNSEISALSTIQKNSLLPVSSSLVPEGNVLVIEKMTVIVTAYSSSSWETDDNPYLTAAGTQVREGIVANNLLPFGTKIRMPELYGNKVFVVEDRMNSKKGDDHIDIWFPSYWQALHFGSTVTEIEIVKEG